MTMVSPDDGRSSISRTARYKKVTKPLLERKRRARINKCLEELRDLMVGAFEVEGDNIIKLEKADILELTVRHLTKLHSNTNDPATDAKRFQAGFGQCAAEACQFILSMPEIDSKIGENLVNHLRSQIADVSMKMSSSPELISPQQVSPSSSVQSVWPNSKADQATYQNISSKPSRERRSPHIITPKRQDTPSLPINQSLICDTSMNVLPRMHDLSKPMTGLLMTVDNTVKDGTSSYNTLKNNPQNATVNDYEAVKRHNAEVKNVIMQKIREQILGRQVKELDSTHSNANPVYSSASNHYQYRNIQMSSNNQDQVSNASIDLRKKSKGAAKHFSPRLTNPNSNFQSIENLNITSQEAINYSTTNRNMDVTNDTENNNKNKSHNTPDIIVRKRKADYRSMHPKKVFMQPIEQRSEIEYVNKVDHPNKINQSQTNSDSSYLPPEHYRHPEYNRYNDYIHENHAASHSNSKYYSSPYHQYNDNNMSGTHDYYRQQSIQRYDRIARREDPEIHENVEDNMWRPW